MADQQRRGRRIARLIKRYRVGWAVMTLALYIVAIPFTFLVFPGNSLWLALLILFSGATAALTTLADLLVSAESSDASHED